MATALYPGTFDPVTYGHLDVVRRGVALFERVVVAVGQRHEKQTIFDVDERVRLFREAMAGMERVEVESFEGLVVDFARKTGASVLLRGLRTMSDFEYEFQMAQTNRHLAPEIDSVFVTPSPQHSFLSSSLIKEVAQAGGAVEEFVPPHVAAALREKLAG
ncbi:MAG: pantetheine-phosphate adenylyltransferase [Planctomycetota bacterium]